MNGYSLGERVMWWIVAIFLAAFVVGFVIGWWLAS